jgi:dTMP kinase
MDRGRFITFEGIDGAGKSTALSFVRGLLEGRGVEVVATREPGGTPVGEAIRGLLLDPATRATADTETLLVFAARAEHLAEVIRPALGRGTWVLCDRFTDATFAYQGGGRGMPLARLAQLRDWVQQGLSPDLTVLVDAPVEVAQGRLRGRGGESDRFERERLEFHERVRQAYLDLAEREPARVLTLDAAASRPEVERALSAVVEGLLA